MGRIMRQFRPDFERRDIQLFVEMLELDDGQKVVLETLFEDYDDEFRPRADEASGELRDGLREMMRSMFTGGPQNWRESFGSIRQELEEMGDIDEETRRQIMQERMQEMQQQMLEDRVNSGADAEMREMMSVLIDVYQDFVAQKQMMRDGFLSSFKEQLSEGQLQGWDSFERFLMREKTLPEGRLSGESTNLFYVIDKMGLEPEIYASISPTLDDYEVALHNALIQRNGYIAQSEGPLLRSFQEADIDESKKIFERQIQFRKMVRDINDQYRQAIVSVMPEDEGKVVNDEILTVSYQRIYRDTPVQRAFDMVLEMPDLNPDVLTSVIALEDAYTVELDQMNQRIVTATRQHEPARELQESERSAGMMNGTFSGTSRWFGGGRDEADPVRDLMDTRSEMDARYMEQLKAMLTPEQAEELPRVRVRREGGGWGGMMGGGGGGEWRFEDMPERIQERMLERYDANNDGTIDEEEMETARESWRQRMQEWGGGRGGQGGDGAGGRGGQGGRGGGGRGGQGGRGGGGRGGQGGPGGGST